MEHTPITKQRSSWEPIKAMGEIMGVPMFWWRRRVHDGTLTVCVGEEPHGWHLSISFRSHKGDYSRYPTWDEIVNAREAHLPDDVGFVMHLPKTTEYVALHDTTFHLHEWPER